jgi:hypothetical protein
MGESPEIRGAIDEIFGKAVTPMILVIDTSCEPEKKGGITREQLREVMGKEFTRKELRNFYLTYGVPEQRMLSMNFIEFFTMFNNGTLNLNKTMLSWVNLKEG